MTERTDRVRSPCVSICALDEQDVCVGCHRTGDEILRWTVMTDEERRRVLENVTRRERESLI
ncbi:MAG: DUF1289 domain-containing protein [Marinobacter sp.]